jgi:hypothetical protein
MAVPSGTICVDDVVEKLVRAQYGPSAVSDLTIKDGENTFFEMEVDEGVGGSFRQKSMYVERDGIKIPKIDDDKRWDDARGQVHTALLNGKLNAFTMLDNGRYDPAGRPVKFGRDDWNHDMAWRSFITGKFAGPMDGCAADVRVLVDEIAAQKWVSLVCEGEETSLAPAETKRLENDEQIPNLKSSKEASYVHRVSGWPKDALPPKSKDDINWIIKNCNVRRDRAREIRATHAPDVWQKAGRRS